MKTGRLELILQARVCLPAFAFFSDSGRTRVSSRRARSAVSCDALWTAGSETIPSAQGQTAMNIYKKCCAKIGNTLQNSMRVIVEYVTIINYNEKTITVCTVGCMQLHEIITEVLVY